MEFTTILSLNLETTGFPDRKGLGFNMYPEPSNYNKYNNCRIVELAYIISNSIENSNLAKIKAYDEIVYPKDFEIKNSQFHGITQEHAKTEGFDISHILTQMSLDLDQIDIIVIHNKNFHYNVLLAECYRIGNMSIIEKLQSKEIVCTMEIGKKYMEYFKYPKLNELYEYCYEKRPYINTGPLYKANLCIKCYSKMTQN